jgi:hypothetical protein
MLFWSALFLVGATLAVYWQMANHEFLNFDDDIYITKNHHVKAYNDMGVILVRQGNYKKASVFFQRPYKLIPITLKHARTLKY